MIIILALATTIQSQNMNPKLVSGKNSNKSVSAEKYTLKDTALYNSVTINASQPNQDNLATLLLIASFIINIILAYITIRQHLLIVKNEKPILHSNTFVELIDKKNYPKEKEQFLKWNSRFYINLVNVGKVPLTDFWIRIPENISFTSKIGPKDVRFKVFYIDEPILPDDKLVVHISADDFFGDNFKILKDDFCDIEIKYKSIKDNKYRLLKTPFNIKHQKDKVTFDYKLSFANSVTSKGDEILPYDLEDWNNIKC